MFFPNQFLDLDSEGRNLGLGIMVHAWNPALWEAEAGGLQIQAQPGQH